MTTSEPLIQRARLADQAYVVLRNRILRRELKPGERLSVPALAAELGLSRTPVREAVQRLVAEGMGVEKVNHGAVVTEIDPAELAVVYELRAVLEGLAARRAAVRRDQQVLTGLQRMLEAHRIAAESGREIDVVRADIAFHELILETADSAPLSRSLRPIHGIAHVAMLSGDLVAWPRDAMVEHEAILAALIDGDADASEAAARRHIEQVVGRWQSR